MKVAKIPMRNILGALAGVFTFCSTVLAQEDNFRLLPQYPKELDTVQIFYDARSTMLKNAEDITGKLTGFQNFKWVFEDVKFAKNDTIWSAKYIIPKGMSMISFNFVSDTLEDRGADRTYGYIITGDAGKMASGGMLGWGLLRTPHLVQGVPFVVDTISYKTPEVLLMWVKYELQNHPENRLKVLYTAATALKSMNTEESLGKLKNEMNALQAMKDLKEDDWLQILRVYREVLRDTAKTVELETKIKTDFPNGQYVRNQQRLVDYKKIESAQDDTARLHAAMFFIDKYPYDASYHDFNDANRITYANA